MLTIVVPGQEFFDEATQQFINTPEITLELEHSLASLSKWESVWHKPFLGKGEKTTEETIGYVIAMTKTQNVPREVYDRLSNDNLQRINEYINAQMTATWFAETPHKGGSPEVITAEIVYYWMISLGIPLECEHWHFDRLITLIKVCNEKNSPQKKKMGRRELVEQRRMLNAQRKAQLKTTG